MAKIEIFPLYIGYSCTTLWVKNSLENKTTAGFQAIFLWTHSKIQEIQLYDDSLIRGVGGGLLGVKLDGIFGIHTMIFYYLSIHSTILNPKIK